MHILLVSTERGDHIAEQKPFIAKLSFLIFFCSQVAFFRFYYLLPYDRWAAYKYVFRMIDVVLMKISSDRIMFELIGYWALHLAWKKVYQNQLLNNVLAG